IWKTNDRGGTWMDISGDLPPVFIGDVVPYLRVSVALDPSSHRTLYASFAEPAPGEGLHFRSIDGGAYWVPLVATGYPLAVGRLYTDQQASTDHGLPWHAAAGPGSRVNTLVIDPRSPATLYAGTDDLGVFKTTDSAVSWDAANLGLVATEIEALAVDPRSVRS